MEFCFECYDLVGCNKKNLVGIVIKGDKKLELTVDVDGKFIEYPDYIVKEIFGTITCEELIEKFKTLKFTKKKDFIGEQPYFNWEFDFDDNCYRGKGYEPVFIKKVKKILHFEEIYNLAIKKFELSRGLSNAKDFFGTYKSFCKKGVRFSEDKQTSNGNNNVSKMTLKVTYRDEDLFSDDYDEYNYELKFYAGKMYSDVVSFMIEEFDDKEGFVKIYFLKPKELIGSETLYLNKTAPIEKEFDGSFGKIILELVSDEITQTIKDIVGEDKELISVVSDIVVKIKDLKKGTKTSIAKLIDYNPQISLVEPLIQGKVSYYVNQVCKKLEIKLVDKDKSIGGLAYFVEFKKG